MQSFEPGEDWRWCYVDEVFLDWRRESDVGARPFLITADTSLLEPFAASTSRIKVWRPLLVT